MKILFALPGFHLFDRGAEVALISVASELAKRGNAVTLIGSGEPRNSQYKFLRTSLVRREHFERFPSIPPFRSEYIYEEATFVPGLLRKYRPADYDVTLTCSYPFTNWVLRRPTLGARRPPHVFITQNGDWPAFSTNSEYRLFGCDGLVCTNPDFYERNKDKWTCRTIPNGVDVERFNSVGRSREALNLPPDKLIVLMVSALIPTKRVELGIQAVKDIPNAHLVVAGDGPLRDTITATAARLLPGSFSRISLPADSMPALYGSADVFLHLSKEESFGNVFLEAMASGLPIVGHDSLRLRWIVGDNEFLTDTENQTAIVSAIRAASRESGSRRAERAKRAEQFSWTRIASSYYTFLEEVVMRTNEGSARS
jgi:glycosyltransferase involved in cell wall biosynthesis